MTKPTLEQSRGYDIMIWVNEGGGIMAEAHTIMGEVVLHGLLPGYSLGQEIEIEDSPSHFFSEVPPTTRIGLLRPGTNLVFLAALGGLQS